VTAASANASASAILVIMVVLLGSKPEWLLFYAGKSSSLRAARFIGIASFGLDLPEKRRDRGDYWVPARAIPVDGVPADLVGGVPRPGSLGRDDSPYAPGSRGGGGLRSIL
jgi:hypothetical protein